MDTITKGIEKLVFKLDINEYTSTYDYETNTLTVGGKSENRSESDYLSIRNNTITTMLHKGAKITMTIDGVEAELPKLVIPEIANYRPQARITGQGKFQGIQGHNGNGNLWLGGNIMHHIIFWDCTKEQADKRLHALIDTFGDKYEFKLVKC